MRCVGNAKEIKGQQQPVNWEETSAARYGCVQDKQLHTAFLVLCRLTVAYLS